MDAILKLPNTLRDNFAKGDDTTMKAVYGVTVLMFVSIIPWGSRALLRLTSIICGVKGAGMLLFPDLFTSFTGQGIKVDGLHLQEIRCIGIIMIGMSLTYLLTRKSSDVTVERSILWSHTVFFGSLLLLTAYGLKTAENPVKSSVKTSANSTTENLVKTSENSAVSKHISQLMVFSLTLWFGGFLFYALRESDWGGHLELSSTRRNTHLRIDFAVFLIHGILAYCFPSRICKFQTTLKALDGLHDYLARVMGAGFLSFGIVSGRASNFLREDDKNAVLLSHAVANLLFFLTMSLCQIFTTVFSTYHFYGIFTVLLLAFNDIIGCEVQKMAKDVLEKLKSTKQE